jgi:hypothetical protein
MFIEYRTALDDWYSSAPQPLKNTAVLFKSGLRIQTRMAPHYRILGIRIRITGKSWIRIHRKVQIQEFALNGAMGDVHNGAVEGL